MQCSDLLSVNYIITLKILIFIAQLTLFFGFICVDTADITANINELLTIYLYSVLQIITYFIVYTYKKCINILFRFLSFINTLENLKLLRQTYKI